MYVEKEQRKFLGPEVYVFRSSVGNAMSNEIFN